MRSTKWYILNDGTYEPVMKAIDDVEALMKGHIERERLSLDRQWLKCYLMAKPGVRWIRVVKTKREGFTFIHRGYHFDAYLVKRQDPRIACWVWMMYLVVQDYN